MFYFRILLKTTIRIVFLSLQYLAQKKPKQLDRQEIILWVCPDFPSRILRYLSSDDVVKDVATISSLKKMGHPVKLFWGSDIGELNGKIIITNYSQRINLYRFKNYVSIYPYIYEQLDIQNNLILPPLAERLFWENKAYMHEEFEKHDINTPDTTIVYDLKEFRKTPSKAFPFLIKEVHSYSSKGIHKIENQKDLNDLFTDKFVSQHICVLSQDLVNMKKDLRVIFVGEEIVSWYWRINPGKEWRPTASNFGSYISFQSFPDQWHEEFLHTFKKLDMTTGAFDITWENDDLTTNPIYLEVSPNYKPNPYFDLSKFDFTYKQYKKSFRLRNNYDRNFIETTYNIQEKYIERLVERHLQ